MTTSTPISTADRDKAYELLEAGAANTINGMSVTMGNLRARVVELEAERDSLVAEVTVLSRRLFCPCDVGTGCMYPDKCWRGQKDRAEASDARATALLEALEKIAHYDTFTEPYSVQIARAALTALAAQEDRQTEG